MPVGSNTSPSVYVVFVGVFVISILVTTFTAPSWNLQSSHEHPIQNTASQSLHPQLHSEKSLKHGIPSP